ncbi:MAG: hypothetical protein RMI89_04100 [Gloeomargarita sp. SKYBB_i_bin120]|nr:hypothetical protein [Gloeomargarita sp. SKYG98]MCS7292140.1 hypothetical protein [Gloeomargarita sp. SKYB120]MDW8177701.1 hypothetical protein [Gloeomargarita sp. SKYBB_i_bin120]
MPRVADEYVVHLLMEGGHREEVRFGTIQEFQKWYQGEFLAQGSSNELINVPVRGLQGEFLVIRPARVVAIRVEPVFLSSIER